MEGTVIRDVALDDLRISRVDEPVGIELAAGMANDNPTESARLGASKPKPYMHDLPSVTSRWIGMTIHT